MSAIAAITINDGAATPVAHTFSPARRDQNGTSYWADRSGGIALGYPTISQTLRNPTKSSRVYKLTSKIVVPVLEVTSPSTSTGIQPAPTKAYDLMFACDMILPERSTLQQRKDLLAYAKNYLATAVLSAAVNDFEAVL